MIGGEHYLQFPAAVDDSLGAVLAGDIGAVSFFSSGRDALFSLLTSLPCATVHLPDLVCSSVLDACRSAGKQVAFYRLDGDFLQAAAAPERGACLLVMHYFGLPNHGLVAAARAAGATVVSDVTHLLFNPAALASLSAESDYLMASLRKSGPFPDGGFLSSQRHPVAGALLPPREAFFALRAAGLLSRGAAASHGFDNDENFALLRKAEALLDASPAGAHGCSYLSRQLLFAVSLGEAASAISRNIAVLSAHLGGVCATAGSGAYPSPYFACVFRNVAERDDIRARLAAHKYFCPVHWPTSAHPVSSPLSDLCLSIPCDARYGEADMLAVASVIKKCLNK